MAALMPGDPSWFADDEPVRAAGGVVWRNGQGGTEILVVHRPRYDDWSLPKGKLNAGEDDEDAALREVEEETGLSCAIGPELAAATYRDRNGRPKVVRYWSMEPVAGTFVPTQEVDRIRWLRVDQAAAVLSYKRDRDVLASLPG